MARAEPALVADAAPAVRQLAAGADVPAAGDLPVRLRLRLGYDGTGFHGWAAQPGLRTVEALLSEALRRALRLPGPPALTVAGRTDAGVHARGQVVHADIPAWAWSGVGAPAGDSGPAAGSSLAGSGRLVRRLNRVLPDDIRVGLAELAPPGFDARFSALWRRYSYRVCDDPAAADPVRRHDTLAHPRRLDAGAMNAAARACLGERDFAAFCRARPGATTVRELQALEWTPSAPGVLVASVTADAFCHNMVRALTGALLAVGDGRRPPGWLAELLAARVRDPGVQVAPPHPLCLEEVGYPPAGELAARAVLTRRVRPDPAAQPEG